MKSIYFTSICLLLVISLACTPVWETTNSANPPNLIKVECRNEKTLQLTVKQILKLVYVADWDIEEDNSMLYIQARYNELPAGKAEEIKYRLQELPGVIEVEIKYDGMPARSIR